MKRELPRALSVPALSNVSTPHQSTKLDRWALERIQRTVRTAPIRFLLWDGFELPSSLAGPAVGSILFRTREALLGWMWNPELYFGETYMSGAVEVRGELSRVLDEIYLAWSSSSSRVWSWWQKANDALTARENVHHHYDLGNEFYRLWLDAELVYTCAYFPTPDATLEEAQIAKMDLVCRKLRLAPGEKVLEAGCGWGSFALFMAKHYGVTVRAFNISAEQMEYARRRAHDEGLADRVKFVEDDYRNVTGRYDAFVSIGMLEHVGLPDYPTLGRVMNRSLLPNGRGLLHFIGRNRPALLNAWIRKRIFPGAYPPTLREVFERVLEPHTLSVLDVENLRLHYARTLEHWLRRFDDASEEVDRMFDQSFTRAWRLYLAGSRAAFVTGWMQLFQVVFARGGSNAIPWTRVSG
jgi:cyclopropane-fatty-acyl-phospholipid synthase